MQSCDGKHKLTRMLVILTTVGVAPAFAQRPMPVPPPARIQPLQLREPFTLVYSARATGSGQSSYTHYRLHLTLSYDGHTLLYRSEDMATHVTRTVLYDGHDTYTMDSNSGLAEIDPGFDFGRMMFCPLPGVGIPKVPLITDGILPRFLASVPKALGPQLESEKRYVAAALYHMPGQMRDYGGTSTSDAESRAHPHSALGSVVSVTDADITKVLWYDTFENPAPAPGHLWEYFAHKRFQGIWLATKLRMRWYATHYVGGPNTLVQEATYELLNAVDGPLEAKAYDPTTYLRTHTNITDTTGPSIRTFVYEPGNGPLQLQRGKGMEISKYVTVSAKSPMNTGLIGLGALVIGSGVWFAWRRRFVR